MKSTTAFLKKNDKIHVAVATLHDFSEIPAQRPAFVFSHDSNPSRRRHQHILHKRHERRGPLARNAPRSVVYLKHYQRKAQKSKEEKTYVISARVRSYLVTFAMEITMKDVQKVKMA